MGWGAVATVAASAIGAASQSDTNAKNANLNRSNRQWQKHMSDTAVQRRMRDMRKGGLNPILAGKYDATTPPGNVPNLINPLSAGDAAATAKQAMSLDKELDILEASVSAASVKEDVMDFMEGGSGQLGQLLDMITSGQLAEEMPDMAENIKKDFSTFVSVINKKYDLGMQQNAEKAAYEIKAWFREKVDQLGRIGIRLGQQGPVYW